MTLETFHSPEIVQVVSNRTKTNHYWLNLPQTKLHYLTCSLAEGLRSSFPFLWLQKKILD